MLNKFVTAMVAVTLLSPSPLDAYGAAHVGYTHVGPGGVQHYGETAYRGPNSAGYAQHASAYGGGYHYGYGAAAGGYRYGYGAAAGGYRYGYGAAAGGYRYTGGAAAGGRYHYAYVR